MGINELPDNELAWRMGQLRNKQEEYSEVFAQYADVLYSRYATQAVNIACYYGLKREDANDAVQVAFIKAFRSIARYNKDREFKNWFFKIVLNCVRDVYNHKKRHAHSDIDTVEFPSEHFSKEFHISLSIRGIINKLPEKIRSTLVLKVYAGLDMDQISQTTGVSVRQVHNRLNQAYALVKKKIEEEGLV